MSAPKRPGAHTDFRERLFPEGFYRTDRLRVAPLEAGDAFPLVFLTNDPLVAHGCSLLPQPFTLADADRLIGLPKAGRGCFAALRAGDSGVMIGCAGVLLREDDALELGFWLGAPYHGKHFGAEGAGAVLRLAIKAFPQAQIVAECPRENAASWRLLRRLGFEPGSGQALREGAELLAWRASECVS